MKKCLLTLAAIGIFLVAASGAWAYSFTFASVLTDSPGTAGLFAGIWSPADPAGPVFGTGFWQYDYEITNITYDTYLTNFGIGIPTVVSVIEFTTPAGWTFSAPPGTFQWGATGVGSELYTGSTKTGFAVRSTYSPFSAPASAWRLLYSPANGTTVGPGVPEPASMSLLGLGLIGLLGGAIRRKFKA